MFQKTRKIPLKEAGSMADGIDALKSMVQRTVRGSTPEVGLLLAMPLNADLVQ